MATQSNPEVHLVRDELLARRTRIAEVLGKNQSASLLRLLDDVDEALNRIELGTYGLCEECHDPIERDRLIADPLTEFCLDHLTSSQQRSLEQDLQLAAKIQRGLLPGQDFKNPHWRICYHYQPAQVISGDYCDLITNGDETLYFVVGDVAGKGVAAALLMSNLHAMFRALIPAGLGLRELMARASRVFCQSTLPTQYATLICGKAARDGQLEVCNAGHVPAVLASGSQLSLIESTDLPLGLFGEQEFAITTRELRAGDTLVLYTDGISEAYNADGTEYGLDGLKSLLSSGVFEHPEKFVESCRQHLSDFRSGTPRHDDETLLALQFAPAQQARWGAA
ncbi:MAG TPA: SpoIIE family protein phosphatase [Clostridia bacterium]|nr:SpoIIE family protein phosphatase [Clostridia bacterium]